MAVAQLTQTALHEVGSLAHAFDPAGDEELAIAGAARMTALRLAPQTLLTVVAPTLVGSPPSTAHCRAMFWPSPADTTFPSSTSSTAARSGSRARCTAARTTVAPRPLA